jgi:ABC-type multidrug transport system permease subunit
MGQAIAAYAPNEYFASISNPLLIGCGLISFCGVVVPYAAMQPFWRYWLYYLDPFHYLVGGLLGTVLWDVQVKCKAGEFTVFDPPAGQTCAAYMGGFLGTNAGYIENGDALSGCQYCPYKTGAEYAKGFNINAEYYGWRDVSCLFPFPSDLPGSRQIETVLLTRATDRLASRRCSASRRMRWWC